jgi:hypothetical protein
MRALVSTSQTKQRRDDRRQDGNEEKMQDEFDGGVHAANPTPRCAFVKSNRSHMGRNLTEKSVVISAILHSFPEGNRR